MTADTDQWEARLLALGKQERQLEDVIRDLPPQSRAAALRGDFTEADRLSALHDKARSMFRDLLKDITTVETRLYRARRSKTYP